MLGSSCPAFSKRAFWGARPVGALWGQASGARLLCLVLWTFFVNLFILIF